MSEAADRPTPRHTRMLVVDEDNAFRQSVCSIVGFGERPSVVESANSLTDARRAMADGDFDVAFIDSRLPDGSGLDVIREMAASRPEDSLVFVAVFGNKARVLASIEAASVAFSAARWNTELPTARERVEDVLSEREIEVLQFLAKGFKVCEVASFLELSDHTVATHVKHIYRKLGVHSRSSCIYEATRLGLIA